MTDQYETYKLGDFSLQSGEVIPDAFIAYKTLGDPSLPAVIYPTWYSGVIASNLWLIGEDKTLNPKEYYIIIPALFGNGQSSSPSNNPSLRPFPLITFFDNVRAQHQLVTQHLGIKHARAVLGWSMGAGQTFQWSTQYPEFMDLIVPFCGSAKTSIHNQVFLEGVKSGLYAAIGTSSAGICKSTSLPQGAFQKSYTSSLTRAPREIGLKALARVYAGWGFSQAFYREKLYATVLGYKDVEDFMVNFWEAWALSKDPENMLCMAHTWQVADVSAQEPYNGDFGAAMRGIKAKALVLPCKTDLYFPPEDSEIEVQGMREGVGRLEVYPSIWGHWAGGPGDSVEDTKWLDDKLREFFAEN
ncbi:homoserine acetyltransferase family protein [Phaeosphaeria sp. MPI-PUGE-AT-0046c]|nr:homoserine acetyltransferase family protein [Phaeosphaeria sp. MPI-PUGE-AT-0046c]